MMSRTMVPLVISYILLIGAGFLFLQSPPVTLEGTTEYGQLLVLWAAFYIVGPVISLTSIGIRTFRKVNHVVALWHFEISGLYLIVAANLIYSYALLRTGLFFGEVNLIAFSLVISAFAASFIGRIIDNLRLVRAVGTVAIPGKAAQ